MTCSSEESVVSLTDVRFDLHIHFADIPMDVATKSKVLTNVENYDFCYDSNDESSIVSSAYDLMIS